MPPNRTAQWFPLMLAKGHRLAAIVDLGALTQPEVTEMNPAATITIWPESFDVPPNFSGFNTSNQAAAISYLSEDTC